MSLHRGGIGDALLRACGGDPARIGPLAEGLRRAADGRRALLAERQGGSSFPPEVAVILGGLVLALVSIVLGFAVVILRRRPDLAAFAIAGPQAATCALLAFALGATSMLADDDARSIGWWPVSLRDVALARLVVLLRPVAGASVALCLLPLIAFAVTGPVPVISAAGLALGLPLQALAAALAVACVLLAFVRLFGREGARRILVGIGIAALALIILTPVMGAIVQPRGPAPEIPAAFLRWSPPGWFAAFAQLADRGAALRAGVGTLVALVILPLTARALASGARAESTPPRRARPRHAPLVALTGAWLAPFTRGREGWVLRRLVTAHLREESRLVPLRLLPVLVAGAIAALLLAPRAALVSIGAPGDLPVRLGLAFPVAAFFLAIPALLLQLQGSDHRAAWLLAQSGLDPSRMAAAMRGVARGLFEAPLLVMMTIAEIRGGAPWPALVADLAISALLFELLIRLLQLRHLVWPFSRPWGAPPDDIVLALCVAVLPISSMVLLWEIFASESWWGGRIVTCALLTLAVVAAHRTIVRATRERGLRLELAPKR